MDYDPNEFEQYCNKLGNLLADVPHPQRLAMYLTDRHQATRVAALEAELARTRVDAATASFSRLMSPKDYAKALKQPPTYDGTEDWLDNMPAIKTYLSAAGVPEESMGLYAKSYLRGRAQTAVQQELGDAPSWAQLDAFLSSGRFGKHLTPYQHFCAAADEKQKGTTPTSVHYTTMLRLFGKVTPALPETAQIMFILRSLHDDQLRALCMMGADGKPFTVLSEFRARLLSQAASLDPHTMARAAHAANAARAASRERFTGKRPRTDARPFSTAPAAASGAGPSTSGVGTAKPSLATHRALGTCYACGKKSGTNANCPRCANFAKTHKDVGAAIKPHAGGAKPKQA